MKNDDSELIQRTLEGDQHAFAQLVEKYQEQVHILAWQKIGDFHIAQEITQDVFLTAYQKFPAFTHYRQFAGWLYVVTNRKCIAWHRKKKIETQSIDETNPTELEEVYYSEYTVHQREEAAKEKRRTIVHKLLSKLQESERIVMSLYYLAEMSCEEIAEFLGVSPNTVRSRLHRARNRLKKEEAVIQENLSSFQLPTQLTENIMKEISRLNPATPLGNKPLVPLAVSAASAIIAFLLIGFGTQNLIQFQKPYNLNAQSERTIEISEAQLVIDSPTKATVRNKVGHTDLTGKNSGVGQTPDDLLFAAANADETEVSKIRPQWVQTKGPEGGSVYGLFTTIRGDVYAGTRHGLYRLTNDGTAWKLINNMEGPSHISLIKKMIWWPVVERQDTLYLATINEILTSSDRGETWDTLCESKEGPLVDMVITDRVPGTQSDMTIYLAYTDGIFRTDDAGKSWIPLSEGLTDREIREIAAVENTIFVSTDEGLFRLNDEKWEHLLIDQPGKDGKTQAILDLAMDEHRIYVVVGEEVTRQLGQGYSFNSLGDLGWSLFQSTDTGNSWDSIDPRNNGFEDKFISTHPTIRIAAMGEKILVIHGRDNFYSSDAGENWTLLDLGHLSKMFNNHAALLYDANTFYKSGNHGIHRTIDGGMSWHELNAGLIGTQVRGLVSVNNTLYVHAAELGLFSSSDDGESWTLISPDFTVAKLMVGYDGVLYTTATSADLRLMRFSDQDKKLTPVQGIPYINPSLNTRTVITKEVIVKGDPPPIPNKNEPIEANNRIEIKTPVKIASFAVSDSAYYVEYQYKLLRWRPGTSEWYDTGLIDEEARKARDKLRYPDDLIDTTSFKLAVSGETVYVGKRNGHLMQSFDEGDTWNDVTANLPFPVERFNAIAFAGKNVYVAADKGVVRSSNGTDWHILTDGEGRLVYADRFAVDGTTVYAQVKQKIYRLSSETENWQQVTPEIPHTIICIDVDGNMLYVGTRTRGVLRFSLEN